MSQSHPEQHHGGSDMQFWQQQQQLLHKQLHELQRQQQLQQLDHGARKQDNLNHLSAVAKPVVLNQSEMMNMSTNNAPNYMWPNNLVRPLPPMSDGKSHMMVASNLNWTQSSNSPVQNVANGLLIPNDQSQAMQSLRYTPQQDQSSYGMPVSNTNDSVDQYHRLSRMSSDCDNLMSEAVENQPDKDLNQLSAFHNNLDILNNGNTSGNFQQANRTQISVQDQAFCGMENQALWSGNLQERVTEQVGTSHGVASLDPTEEKFLYGNDDDNWGVSLAGSLNSGSEVLLHVLPSVNDCFGGFPSLQSGSWSALMQEAVQSSTSDNGLQEEWSSLDFHKMEQSMSKTKVISGDSGKQLSAWNDNNMQAASSLTARPLSLFNPADAGPSLSIAPSFQHSYQSTYNENNGMQTDASHMLFHISSGEDNNKQFHQGQKPNQLSECNAQLRMLDNGMWMSQTYQQQNNSTDLQNSRGSSRRQQTLTTSNVQPDNGPSGLNSDNAVEPSAVSNSVFSVDGNVWKVGATHVNPNSRVGKPVESDIGTSRVQTNGSFMGTYGSVMSNSPNFTQESNQQVVFGKTFTRETCAITKGDRNAGGNHTEPSERRPQTWESTKKNTDDGDNYQHSKKQLERVSKEGYASNNFNYIQQSSDLSNENGSPTWIDKNPFRHGSIRLPTESDQQAAGSTMLHNQTTTLGMNRGPSYSVHSSHFQAVSPISQGSKSEDHKYVRKSDFNGHNLSDYVIHAAKRTHMGVEETCSIDSISVHGSTSFDPSSIDCSQNKNIIQTSQDMLDLLPKVDHSRNNSTVAVPENPAQSVVNAASPNSSTHDFGLRLVPPSQRQLSHTVLSYQSSSADKSRQHNAEIGDKDQCGSSYAPVMQSLDQNNASQREILSSMRDDRPNVVSDFGKQFHSLPTSVPDIPYPGKQQQAQFTSVRPLLQHQQSERHGREVPHQTKIARNVSLRQQAHGSLDDSASDQSVLKSLPILDSGVPSSSLAPLAHINEPSSLKSDSAERDNRDKTIAGFRQVHNSNSFSEKYSGAQTSVSGTTQQAGFTRMLHNLGTNISAQQRLAGLHPPKLTPQILQSIISNNRDTSFRAPQKATEEADKGGTARSEVVTSYSDFEHQGGNQCKAASLNQPCSVRVDAAPRSNMSPGEETWRAPSDGNSNVSISSLVRLHQQDLDKGKIGQNAIPQSQISSAPNLSGDVRLSRQSLMISDVQQQNYSLLHQIQAMKDGNSDRSRMLSGSLKGAIFPSNSQMNWNADSRFVSLDGKVGATSQSSFPSDLKMLNSTSMDNEEINTSMSTDTAGQHDFLNRIDTIGTNSSGNSVGAMEHTQISPHMASPCLKQYRSYKNGIPISANFNDQWNPNASSLHHLFPKAPRSMDYNLMADDNNNIAVPGQSSASTAIVTKGLPSNLFPTLSDQDIVQRSLKRKSVPLELISWNKVVTRGQQRFKSIRTAELDWARAANRLCEKADNESLLMEDSLSIAQPRRRIILTSQLMQLLIPAVPARMLRVEANIAYESVTFCVAKAALTDACSMISCSEKNHDANFEDERGASKRFKTLVGDHVCSTLVENYVARSKKMENDFLRFDRRASLLDVRLECQELEKFSTVNRLGKFHGRPHTDAVEGSAISAMLVQRYVTAFPAPGNLPEGITYLSL